MLTRTARRHSGSQHDGVTSTPSIFSAAAERNSAPTFVASTIFSSTAMRRAFRQTDAIVRGCGRRMAHSTPRVSAYPVSCASVSSSAVYTGISPQRSISAACGAKWRRAVSIATGTHPARSADAITLGLSAMNIPFAGSTRLRSCALVSPANSGASSSRVMGCRFMIHPSFDVKIAQK